MNLNVCENLIFDIGMHSGQDTSFYLKKGFSVVGVEPNIDIVEQVRNEFSDYVSNNRLTILSKGISDRKETRKFYINKIHSEWSSFVEDIGQREGSFQEIEVECITLNDLFLQYGYPYYLKIDTEGYDLKVICCLFQANSRPRYISIASINIEALNYLYESGYSLFKLVNQKMIPKNKYSILMSDGNHSEHFFPPGSSGPFGEETLGEWQNYQTVSAEIQAYWNIPAKERFERGWFDLHAKFE